MFTNSTYSKDALDAHVRETVAWHFDPATGSPFWLDFASDEKRHKRTKGACENDGCE